jgi:hypothetical protein
LHGVARHRIVNDVLGALIALLYGLVVSWLLERTAFRHPGTRSSAQRSH